MIEAQRIGRDREGTSDSFLLRLLPGAGLACSALGEALPLRCKGFARQNLKEKTNLIKIQSNSVITIKVITN